MSDPARTLAERYVLEAHIASGGMAEVWRARDDVLARTVAVKLLHASLAKDDSFVERFRVEALAAARLAHPNIVAIYDTGSQEEADGRLSHFIVMEHCGAGTLADLFAAEGPLDPDRVRGIGATICQALDYAHRHDVVHRDIKPGNVLVSDHQTLKVTDFGIAKAAFASGDITTTGSIIGTVTYISPEQAEGEEPDARSDIYALGVTLYEAVVGRPPFRSETEVATALAHIHETPPAPRSIKAGVPRDLENVILKALSKRPEDRFATAEEMRAALGDRNAGSTQMLGTRRPTPPPQRSSVNDSPTGPREFVSTEGRRLFSVVALVVLAVIAALIIGTLVDDGPNLAGRDTDEGGRAGGGSSNAIEIVSASDFDPQGGDGEHPSEVPNAWDGDQSTTWNTSQYSSALNLIKDGVGLRFDLGEATDVAEVEVIFDRAGYSAEILVSDEEGSSADDYEVAAQTSNSGSEETFSVDASGRYWVVWITGFPGGGGGRGSIAEVRFLGG